MQRITGETSTVIDGITSPITSTGAFVSTNRGLTPSGIARGSAWGTMSFDFDSDRVARTSSETRSANIALAPRIVAY